VKALANIEAKDAYRAYRDELIAARLLIPLGTQGVYGRSQLFELIVERFDDYVSRRGASLDYEVLHFPPVFHRSHYERTGHINSFPDLMGSVHGFCGAEREHRELITRLQRREDWAAALEPTELMLLPAACYPLYPVVSGVLPKGGRRFELKGFVFRREPSDDPARMQVFRMHEYIRLGSPEEALEHRDHWLQRGKEMLQALGLHVAAVLAADPFFGRGGRVMEAIQREQALKYELVTPICSDERPTAIASFNCHLDHFGLAFDIRTTEGRTAHSACVGFGLERVALALFKAHGFDPARWPKEVRGVLAL
jgi:seryl-tRNA synthetase